MVKTVDISQFDAIAVESKGEPFELIFKGKPTGISLNVLGSNSDVVRAYTDARLIEFARSSAFAKSKGTDAELNHTIKLLQDREKNSIESALVRVNGWENASYKGSTEFNKEGLRELFTKNPVWVGQVIEFSEELGK